MLLVWEVCLGRWSLSQFQKADHEKLDLSLFGSAQSLAKLSSSRLVMAEGSTECRIDVAKA